MEILSVVARYQEDLKWVEDLNTDVVIYNKGESFPFEYPRFDVENIGREAETFLKFIVEFYDSIEKCDAVAFLQGNPYSHCDDVVKIINSVETCDELIYLANSINTTSFLTHPRIHNKPFYILSGIFGEPVASFSDITNGGGYKVALLCECLRINLDLKLFFKWGGGAQYIVPAKFITNRGYKWWEDTYKTIMLYLKAGSAGDEAAYILEYSWPLLFNPKYKVYKDEIE